MIRKPVPCSTPYKRMIRYSCRIIYVTALTSTWRSREQIPTSGRVTRSCICAVRRDITTVPSISLITVRFVIRTTEQHEILLLYNSPAMWSEWKKCWKRQEMYVHSSVTKKNWPWTELNASVSWTCTYPVAGHSLFKPQYTAFTFQVVWTRRKICVAFSHRRWS